MIRRPVVLSKVHHGGSEDANEKADQRAEAGKENKQQQEYRHAAAPWVAGDELKVHRGNAEQSHEAEEAAEDAARLQAAARWTWGGRWLAAGTHGQAARYLGGVQYATRRAPARKSDFGWFATQVENLRYEGQ